MVRTSICSVLTRLFQTPETASWIPLSFAANLVRDFAANSASTLSASSPAASASARQSSNSCLPMPAGCRCAKPLCGLLFAASAPMLEAPINEILVGGTRPEDDVCRREVGVGTANWAVTSFSTRLTSSLDEVNAPSTSSSKRSPPCLASAFAVRFARAEETSSPKASPKSPSAAELPLEKSEMRLFKVGARATPMGVPNSWPSLSPISSPA
mmetsp:Transcript_90007/g.197066  ORF Transcript_90007/g.197066 Transcript_90007/m.197066 type:complete len:212 (+) Transcript_90007:811-1446(+)